MFVCVYIYIQSKKDQDQKFTGKAFMLINGEIVCVCGGGGGGGSFKFGTNCDPNILYKHYR